MPYSLSPSTINLFLDCPKCFWLQFRKNIKRPEGIFPSLPSGIDRILKEHFDSYIEKNDIPPVLKKHNVDAKLFSNLELLNKWRDQKIGLSFTDNKGNILRGAVDNLLIKDNKLIVLDYKTRGYEVKNDTHEHYRVQLDLYNFLLRKNGYETENYSYLLFYHPDKIVENVFLFHTHLVKIDVNIKEAEKIWKDALKLLDESMPNSSENCEYCKYRETKIDTNLKDYY
ncbi:MAG: PD-(D/E)XK nuclease family protein [Candidatus Woesearchaeota archaeon]